MAATLAERLTSVEAAISAIEGGAQSFTFMGRTYTRADLKTLYDQQRYLETRVAREAGVRRTVAEF